MNGTTGQHGHIAHPPVEKELEPERDIAPRVTRLMAGAKEQVAQKVEKKLKRMSAQRPNVIVSSIFMIKRQYFGSHYSQGSAVHIQFSYKIE